MITWSLYDHCPAGAGGCCKHVAAQDWQRYPMTKQALRNFSMHVPKKAQSQDAVLFEDLISPHDSYEKDKIGRCGGQKGII